MYSEQHMKKEISYEWVVEPLDDNKNKNPDADITDPMFFKWQDLSEALQAVREFSESHCRLALRRDIGNDEIGLIDRGYAYVNLKTLSIEKRFCSGEVVSRRFVRMLQKHL